MATYRNYSGPNAAGSPKTKIPDWLNHTANAKADESSSNNTAAQKDPGPNQVDSEKVSAGS